MNSKRPPLRQRSSRVSRPETRLFLCLAVLLSLAVAASAQSTVSPTTSTAQIAGTPNAQSSITAPNGGIILYGTALSSATNQPVRHLWVADGTAGICRMDPDLDSPGPYAINPSMCPLSLTKVTGGAMAFDASQNFLYFVDSKSNTRGVFRVTYVPSADNGNGSLDFSTTFSMGGNTTTDKFPGGQTGCLLPNNPSLPDSAALDPEGNLWVGFLRSGEILRFNNPGSATASGFGTCAQFIQVVAATPDGHLTTGLAWMGHDLWGADGKSPFFIRNADTACLVSPNPVCTNKADTSVLTSVGTTTVLIGDQVYPATNGNNLYVGQSTTNQVVWIGNVAGGTAGQTLSLSYINAAQLPAAAPLKNIGALVLDSTDPANLVLYTGDDPSGLGTAGAGRWFQTIQTAAAPQVPGAPLNVVAEEIGTNAIVSWSPAQAAQQISGYTVQNNFASNGLTLPDVSVVPNGGSIYPPTSVTIPGLVPGVVYQFQVVATNAQGSSALSAPSNSIPVGITLPGTPTGVTATPGDTQAYVSWTLPQIVNGITSYTVTARVNGVPAGISATVPAPPAGSSTANVLISGLTDGTAYTFTVHATNSAGNGFESAPSLAVTPLITIVPNTTIVVLGPAGVASTPTQVTYTVQVQNASLFPIQNVAVNNILSTIDGAFLVSAVPDLGTCTAVGSGITQTVCSVAGMAPGQTMNITVVAQMNAATITLTSKVTAFDVNGASTTFSQAFRTTQPSLPPPPPNVKIPVTVQANAIPTDLHPLSQGTILWTVGNNTTVAATNVVFTITIDPLLSVNSVSVTPNSGSNTASCAPPVPGLGGNKIVCTIASLGGPAVNNVTPVQSMKITVFYTAPNQTGLQFTPSGTVAFDGVDGSNPTAGVVIRVR